MATSSHPAPGRRPFLAANPSVLWFLLALAIFTAGVSLLSEGLGLGLIPTAFIKTLGKTLCLCLVALAMDLIWGYTGILSLGHMAFFALGGYMLGMWLMYARTEEIVVQALAGQAIPASAQEVAQGVAVQIFGVVGTSELPLVWSFAHQPWLQLPLILLVPGLLALVFGFLAFRAKVNGVYLSILTQAMTLALSLWLFQNESGFRGNNGLSGLQNLPYLGHVPQSSLSIWFFLASAFALGASYLLLAWLVSGRFGSALRAIRDDEQRLRFLGYRVESYKLLVFTLSAMIAAIAGALYFPQAGIINPAELAPIASIYLAVWVAIGGRGRLYGAVLGAAFVSLLSSWFTGGMAPSVPLGFYTLHWVDWWTIALGLSFVLVTLFAPRGLAGIFAKLPSPHRRGAALGPSDGALQEKEADE